MNEALKKFHDEFCPNISYDDPKLTVMLIEKIQELKGEKNNDETLSL